MSAVQQRDTFGIGASEIAAIAGLSKYSSPWDVYSRKIGEAPERDDEDETSVHTRSGWGHRLEPTIRQAYADLTGLDVLIPPGSLFHHENRWARATPDGIASDHEERRLVQIKNVGQFLAREWADQVPDYVQLQEQWELYVTDLRRADVAALIGGGEFRVFPVYRDDEMIDGLVTIARDFWEGVQTRRPPTIDASDACRAHITKRLTAKKVELVADQQLEMLAQRFQEHYFAAKIVQPALELVKAQILGALAEAKADRLVSSVGTLRVQRREEKTIQVVDWEAVARAAAAPEQLATLVAANTTTRTTPASVALYAPREWGNKE